jgi:hypothetical protein
MLFLARILSYSYFSPQPKVVENLSEVAKTRETRLRKVASHFWLSSAIARCCYFQYKLNIKKYFHPKSFSNEKYFMSKQMEPLGFEVHIYK